MTAAQNDDQTIDYSSAEATLTVTNIPAYQPPADVDPPPNPDRIDTPPIVMDDPDDGDDPADDPRGRSR